MTIRTDDAKSLNEGENDTMDRKEAEQFFEEDEPAEKIRAIARRGPSGYTSPPPVASGFTVTAYKLDAEIVHNHAPEPEPIKA